MTVDFADHPPLAPSGFPLNHVHFSGGRTAMAVAGHGGIVDLLYYGRQSLRGASIFHSGFPHSPWPKVFRLALEVDGQSYYPGFQNTRYYPFGYETEGNALGVQYRFQAFLLNDALVQRVQIVANPDGRKLRLKAILHGHVHKTPSFRSWAGWRARSAGRGVINSCLDVLSEDSLRADILDRKKNPVQKVTFENTDVGSAETFVGLSSTLDFSFQATGGVHEGFKNYFRTEEFTEDAAFAVCFGWNEDGLGVRMDELAERACQECDHLADAYAKRIETSPRIQVGPLAFRSCMENIPPVLDSLKVADLPGAMRAAAHGYWVWSWDNLVYPEAYLFANDAAFVRDLLRFVIEHADPDLGIPHQFNTCLTPQMAMAFPVQCLFITTLYSYYCHTGDAELLGEALPLAIWILEKCQERKAGDSGLIEGTSLYPDFPGLLGQDGRDVSVFNNSVYYQGLVALGHLAEKMGSISGEAKYFALSRECSERAKETREAFLKSFFDPEAGYFVDSVSAVDFSARKHYPVYAILWVSPFARDLLGSEVERIAAFMSDNFVRPHGLGMFAGWDAAWMRDGNQCGAYYPVVEPFFCNVMKWAGRARESELWTKNAAWFWETHTIPEGLTYDSENELPDNPGTKQSFAAKAWYETFFRTLLGVELGISCITINPGPFVMEGLIRDVPVRGSVLDIHIRGGSGNPQTQWNGQEMTLPIVIPYAGLKQRNELVLQYS